jgi:hypothetical protein
MSLEVQTNSFVPTHGTITAPSNEEPQKAPPENVRRRYVRRTPGDRLRDALVNLGEHHAQILRHDEKAWASITFAGTRHTLSILFAGPAAVEAGEHFIADLPEHEFAIAGHLVADAAISSAEHRMLPSPRLTVECEVLLLEEG